MGLVDRFSRAMRAHLYDLLESDDPQTQVARAIEELNSGVRAARKDQQTTLASAKRLEEQAERERQEARRWEERAALALRSRDEELARAALKERLKLDREATRLSQAADEHRVAAGKLETSIEALLSQARDLEARKGVIVAEVLAARSARNLTGSELGRATDRVAALEAELEVAQLLSDPQRAALEARFATLESGALSDQVEDELRELKRQLSTND